MTIYEELHTMIGLSIRRIPWKVWKMALRRVECALAYEKMGMPMSGCVIGWGIEGGRCGYWKSCCQHGDHPKGFVPTNVSLWPTNWVERMTFSLGKGRFFLLPL